jgi:mRNA interferase RelE/StbE
LPTNLDHQRQPGSLAAPASGESAGDCRIMYEIEDDRLLILVLRVGHRREIYRAL